MDIWTSRTGYPIVTVMEESNGLHLQQNRYLSTGDPTLDEDELLYPIMISMLTAEGTKELTLEKRSIKVPLRDLSFFKLNAGQAGFYHTLYSPARLIKLGDTMTRGHQPVEDRIGIIGDATALATSGYQKTSALLGLLLTLTAETNKNVWITIGRAFTALQSAFLFESPEIRIALTNLKKDIYSPVALQLGWDFSLSDDLSSQEQKAEIFKEAGLAGNEM